MATHLTYKNEQCDGMKHSAVPAVRIVRASENIKNAEALLNRVCTQTYIHFDPEICVIPAGGEIILDFGCELHGQLMLNTPGTDEIRVRITLGESVSETLGTPTRDHAIHQGEFDLPRMGTFTFGSSAFRFVRIQVPQDQKDLLLMGVAAIAVFRDWAYEGSFESSDERLNRIWQTGAYTVHLNCQEYIYDGVKRDRFVWMGDLYPEICTSLNVFRESFLIEKSLDFMREKTTDRRWMNGIFSYSCWWIVSLYELYLRRGNKIWLMTQKAYFEDLLKQLMGYVGEDGAVTFNNWLFLDWSTADNEIAKRAGIQGLMAWTMSAGASLANAMGLPELAKQAQICGEKLRAASAPDCGGNKIAAAIQTMGDLKNIDYSALLKDHPALGISTFYGYFVLLAHRKYGNTAGALQLIRDYWGAMLDFGATTFWEDFDLTWTENAFGIDQLPVPGKKDIHGDFGKHCYIGLRHSLCHGWAGGPTAFLSDAVLGVKILKPGYREVSVQPDLCGLEYVRGSVPTPFGPIEITAEKNGKTKINVPDGITLKE